MRNKKLRKKKSKKFQKFFFLWSKIWKNLKISGFLVISGWAVSSWVLKISGMKAIPMFYNISKNKTTENNGQNVRSCQSLIVSFGHFLVVCPVFWSCRLAFFGVKRDCCCCLERIDIGEDVGREKKGKKNFFEFFCDFSKNFFWRFGKNVNSGTKKN